MAPSRRLQARNDGAGYLLVNGTNGTNVTNGTGWATAGGAAVAEEHVQDWRDRLENEAVPATVSRKLVPLSTFFRCAGEARLVTSPSTVNIHGVEEVAPRTFRYPVATRLVRDPLHPVPRIPVIL